MLPVVSLMGRVTNKPTKIGPFTVPAGVVVGTPLCVRAKGGWGLGPHAGLGAVPAHFPTAAT